MFAMPAAAADNSKDCEQLLSIEACSAVLAREGETQSNRAIAYYTRGNAYARKRLYSSAIADYTSAIELNPKLAAAYNNRGNAYTLWAYRRRDDRAIADYNHAVELSPKYAEAYNNRGNAYAEKDEYDRAIADYTRAIKLNPKYAAAYNNRGKVYMRKLDEGHAWSDYNRAGKLNPEYHASPGVGYALSELVYDNTLGYDNTEAISNPWKEGTWKSTVTTTPLGDCTVELKCTVPDTEVQKGARLWVEPSGIFTRAGTRAALGLCQYKAPDQECKYCVELRADCDRQDLDKKTVQEECCGRRRLIRH
jgi:tetratricopeptide (TPR) repeat protein